MPKVSVIIPVYGVEKYIEKCARSLFSQTLDDIEYIFIDDCTPDKSIEILKQVVEDYPYRKSQVVIHQMERNSGQAAVRKWAILNAKGEYIFHCDSDDWIDDSLLETMYNISQENNMDIVICDFIWTDGVKPVVVSGGYKKHRNDCISDLMHRKMLWSLCNKLIKRNLYNYVEFPIGDMGEDMCLCLQLFYFANNIDYIKDFYYYYNIHSDSTVMDLKRDKVLSKFKQLTANIDIINTFFNSRIEDKRWDKGLDYLSFYKYELLQSLLTDFDILKIWKVGIKETASCVIGDSNAPMKQRIKALLLLLGYIPK